MLITRIELENIKSYRQFTVDLRRGTTAISGANGAGKTTLVEAIGFALFGYLPYNHDQFVREGEKAGKVVVHLLGGDDRPYVVERRCGSGARWLVFDKEADLRLEQRADVLDKLHEIFGIDRERPLDSLFRDALGVPQGTFTAIFLEVASKRKQTFDALLQIEDYKTAADNLLDTQKYYKEKMLVQQGQIQHLTFLTSDLEALRTQLQEARQLDQQQKTQNVIWSQQLTEYETQLTTLNEQLSQLLALEQRFRTCRATSESAQHLLQERSQQLQMAREAHERVVASQQQQQRYLQAQEALASLRKEAKQRDTLRQQHNGLENTKTKIESSISHLQDRLTEVVNAHQKIAELAPLLEQQLELEKRRDEAKQREARYGEIVKQGKSLNTQLTKLRQQQEQAQQRISEIEPLQPLAELLQERNEAYTQLRIQASERGNKMLHLQEKREALREKQIERDQTAEKLRKAENNVSLIEEHRQEAEEMPVLQQQRDQLASQKHRLEGNIEGYLKSRTQSAGGQCPLLHESCLNIRHRGIASLESYFDGLLTEEHVEVERITQQQNAVQERIEQVKKFAEALNKLGQYTERRDGLAEQLQRLARELTRLEREVQTLTEDLDLLKQVEQKMSEAEKAYNESKHADTRVRDLPGLYKQLQQVQEQIRQLELELDERRQEAAQLKDSSAQVLQCTTELQALNDPRAQSQAQQSIVAKEAGYQQQLQAEQQRLQELLQQLSVVDEKLTVYIHLDESIAQQEALLKQNEAGYQVYLQNQQIAQRLPQYQQAHQQQAQLSEEAERQLRQVEHEYNGAQAAFNAERFQAVQETIERLRKDLLVLAQQMQHHQEYMNGLQQKIIESEAYLVELEQAQQAYNELEDLHAMTEQFRKLFKEAAPHVLRAILADISAEANRIFGEIMGDRTGQLSWRNDYEIILRRQGVERSFAQLSGGEQMSAALAVRLALLKKLSTLNIAFFDEPTQNMDELRRMNLAEQIRRVRGFDQLLVISHDDTFEQGLDSLIRLHKSSGETSLSADKDSTSMGTPEPFSIFDQVSV